MTTRWTDELTLRSEVMASDGSIGDLQMSLHKAVYQTVDVPYRDVDYYAEITQPTPHLVGFLARLTRRLSGGAEPTALFHLDQGMGGGKSHALIGCYHLAHNPDRFLRTELGQQITADVESSRLPSLVDTKVVTLCADHFSPGAPSEGFGPSTNLFERFLWSLFDGDRNLWEHHVAQGPNKGTLQQALIAAARPVLILLDELMDYAMALSDARQVDRMPTEQAFLNALMDACDDVPQVALVIVMIRSELDERGYTPHAADFRAYIGARLVRNGQRVTVTESQDFASIIRRRLFERTRHVNGPAEVATELEAVTARDPAWKDNVLDKLGPTRTLAGLTERLAGAYPFHPDLMDLVQQEWSQVQGFQRVRSTVAIFALTALHWVKEAEAGRWVPRIIGPGDIPLSVALDAVLSSGLLLGNDRAIQGYRAVASTDITNSTGESGRAIDVDQRLRQESVATSQPAPAVRMATALFCYSLVARPQGRRGATKAELLAALIDSTGSDSTPFTAAEEVFNQLVGADGLGALEMISSPNAPARFWLSIKQTLRMYFNAAALRVELEAKTLLVWETAQRLASSGRFEDLYFVEGSDADHSLAQRLSGVDTDSARLVVLDPREWTLLNGRDNPTRDDIRSMLGVGESPVVVDNAASCVIACVNTQRRGRAVQAAGDVLTWSAVAEQVADADDEERGEVGRQLSAAERRLRDEVARAFQHYAYLTRNEGDLQVEFRRFDSDRETSLNGTDVWRQLVADGRAVEPGQLSARYVGTLLAAFSRVLTPREIVQSFYKDPRFPLVNSPGEIRSVLAHLVSTDSSSDGGWELVDAAGNRLNVTSADQIAINSISQTLRPAEPSPPNAPGDAREGDTPSDGQSRPAFGQPAAPIAVTNDPTASDFKRYIVDLPNRSLRGTDERERVWRLIRELAKIIDPARDDLRHELLSLRIELNTVAGHQGDLEQRATEADARVRVEDDDF